MTRAPTPRQGDGCKACSGSGTSPIDGSPCDCWCHDYDDTPRTGAFEKWPPAERPADLANPSENLRLADGMRSWRGPR